MKSLRRAGRTEELIGKELALLRKKRGFSQEELGFQAGVHRTYVSQIERGTKSPTLSVILKLSRALGYPAGRWVAQVEKKLSKEA